MTDLLNTPVFIAEGENEDGCMTGGGAAEVVSGPYMVFMPAAQDYLPAHFASFEEAEQVATILNAAHDRFAKTLSSPVAVALKPIVEPGPVEPIIRSYPLSTAHVPKWVAEVLDLAGADLPFVTASHDAGWILSVKSEAAINLGALVEIEDICPGMGQILRPLYARARAHDCGYLMFDRDIEVDKTLPHWEW